MIRSSGRPNPAPPQYPTASAAERSTLRTDLSDLLRLGRESGGHSEAPVRVDLVHGVPDPHIWAQVRHERIRDRVASVSEATSETQPKAFGDRRAAITRSPP
eukprot:scaffold309_cov235-Pinguiococcus_pyrenoidosus.AAC.22